MKTPLSLIGLLDPVGNFIVSPLAAPVTTSDSTLSVDLTGWGLFSAILPPYDVSVDTEIMRVTGLPSAGVLSVLRAQQGTAAAGHATGAIVRLTHTARTIQALSDSIEVLSEVSSRVKVFGERESYAQTGEYGSTGLWDGGLIASGITTQHGLFTRFWLSNLFGAPSIIKFVIGDRWTWEDVLGIKSTFAFGSSIAQCGFSFRGSTNPITPTDEMAVVGTSTKGVLLFQIVPSLGAQWRVLSTATNDGTGMITNTGKMIPVGQDSVWSLGVEFNDHIADMYINGDLVATRDFLVDPTPSTLDFSGIYHAAVNSAGSTEQIGTSHWRMIQITAQ